MLKKYSISVLIGLVLNLTFSGLVFAQDTQTRATEKAKISVAKFGTGGKLTEVKLNDGKKIKGYITEIKDDHFVLVSKKNGASVNVLYNEVKSVRRTFTTFSKSCSNYRRNICGNFVNSDYLSSKRRLRGLKINI